MKWFLVVVGIMNGQPQHAVDWRTPYDSDKQCEASVAKSLAPGFRWAHRPGGGFEASDGARLYCEQIGEQ